MRVVEAPASFDRTLVFALMRLADDSERAISRYRDTGRLFLLEDEVSTTALGQLLVVLSSPTDAEIKSISVLPDRQGQGLGTMLINAVLSALKRDGITRVTVATSTADVDNIAFYQRVGFRCLSIERDAFTRADGYGDHLQSNRIPIRDRIWFERFV